MAPKRTRLLQLPSSHSDKDTQTRQKSRKRELSLKKESRQRELPTSAKRERILDTQTRAQNLLKEKKVLTKPLPSTAAELTNLEKNFKDKKSLVGHPVRFDEESSGGSTSSELKVGNLEGRTRRPQRKQKGLLKEYVNVTMEHAQLEMTPLEMAAVTKRVRSNYRKRLEDFMEFVLDRRYPLEKDEEMDLALVIYFNHKFSEGEGSYVGDYTLAALCDRDPSFGKLGHRKIPRAWRCLKGWRKLCPSRSRLAYPLAVWCAISWRMVVLGHRQKAIFNLVQLSSYHRPSTLLQLRKMGLVKPTQGITKFWSLVTSLSETSDVSKTGTKDDSILLDSSWMTFIHPLLEELARGKKMDKVWTFNYSEYLTVFREACDQLRLDVVPYQARHSGPSIDRAANNRTQEEVRKRGGWMSRTSTARYEKAGRLAATWQKLDPAIQLCCSLAERHIGDIILDQEYPHISLP